jgi:hypothetical protein
MNPKEANPEGGDRAPNPPAPFTRTPAFAYLVSATVYIVIFLILLFAFVVGD